MTGLEAILETLNRRFTFDARARIAGCFSEGVLPRFVLGRAAEGCVWRFRADLPPGVVAAVARLAAREPGARFDGELPAEPERLAAIERLIRGQAGNAGESDRAGRDREVVVAGGIRLAELWQVF